MNEGRRARRAGWLAGAVSALIGVAAAPGCATRSPDRTASPGAPAGRLLNHRFAPGAQWRYDFDAVSRVRTDLRALGQQKGPSRLSHAGEVAIAGELWFTAISVTVKQVVLAVRMRKPRARVRLAGNPAPAPARLARDLTQTAFVTAEPSGKVLGVRLAPGLLPVSGGIVRAILAMSQIVISPKGASAVTRWRTEEEDTQGRYLAVYELVRDQATGAGKVTVKKSKQRYLPRKAGGGRSVAPVKLLPRGAWVATFGPQGLESMKGDEEVTTRLSGRTLSRTQTRVRLRLRARTQAGAPARDRLAREWAQARAKGRALALFVGGEDRAASIATHRRRLKGATVSQLLARLKAAGPTPDSDTRTSLYLAFRSLAHLRPGDCGALGRVLERMEAHSPGLAIIGAALAQVGHPSAQKALSRAARARLRDARALTVLVPLFARIRNPGPQAVRTLKRIARKARSPSVVSTAQLVLGAISRVLAPTAPRRARRLVSWAMENLRKAKDDSARVQWLLVLGNAGSQHGRAALGQHARHSAPNIRGAALWAMRWIPDRSVDGHLARAIGKDPVSSVRKEAIRTLGYRTLQPVTATALKAALSTDRDELVRLAAMHRLWAARDQHSDVLELVQHAARSDRFKRLRRAAKKLLRSRKAR